MVKTAQNQTPKPQKASKMKLRQKKNKTQDAQEIYDEDNCSKYSQARDQIQSSNQPKGNLSRPKNNEAQKIYLLWCKPRRLTFYFHAYTLTTFYLMKSNIAPESEDDGLDQEDQFQLRQTMKLQASQDRICQFISHKNRDKTMTLIKIKSLFQRVKRMIKKDNFPKFEDTPDIDFKKQYTGQYSPNSLQNGLYEYRKDKLSTKQISLKADEVMELTVLELKAFALAFLQCNKLLSLKVLKYLQKYWQFIQKLVINSTYDQTVDGYKQANPGQIGMHAGDGVSAQYGQFSQDQDQLINQQMEIKSQNNQSHIQNQNQYQIRHIFEQKDIRVGNGAIFFDLNENQEEQNIVDQQNQNIYQHKDKKHNQIVQKPEIEDVYKYIQKIDAEDQFYPIQLEQNRQYGDKEQENELDDEFQDSMNIINTPFNQTIKNKQCQLIQSEEQSTMMTRSLKKKNIKKKQVHAKFKIEQRQKKQKNKEIEKKDRLNQKKEQKKGKESQQKKIGINQKPPRSRNKPELQIVCTEMQDKRCCAQNLANYIWHAINDIQGQKCKIIS